MKRITLIFGVIAYCLFFLGAFFKILHWPGSGVVLTISIAFFAFGYSPLLMINRNQLTQDGYQKFINLTTMIIMVLASVTFLFKTMHWPGTGILVGIISVLLAGMIPVLFIHASKESDPLKKLNFYNEAILMVLFTAIVLFIWLR